MYDLLQIKLAFISINIEINEYEFWKKSVSYSDNLTKQNQFPYRKKYNFNVIPHDFMDNDHIVNNVSAFVRDVSSIRHSQEAINELYSRFVQVHENEMSSKLQRLKASPKKSQSKKRNPLFEMTKFNYTKK